MKSEKFHERRQMSASIADFEFAAPLLKKSDNAFLNARTRARRAAVTKDIVVTGE